MTKSISVAMTGMFAVLAMSFLAVTPASAAVTLQDSGFKINGNTSDTIQPGDDYEITVNADVTGDSEIDFFRVRLYEPGDSGDNWVANSCQKVDRIRALNDENIRFNAETPSDIPNGPYRVHILPFGIEGEAQSNGCDLANDIGPGKFYENRLFVDDDEEIVGNSNDTSDDDVTVGGINLTSLLASINALTKAFEAFQATKPADGKPAFCATMPVYSGWNRVTVQTWLMNNGFAAPFNSVGIYNASQLNAPNVVWGSKSNDAYNMALAQCN